MSTTPAPQSWSHDRFVESLPQQFIHLVHRLGRALRCFAFWIAALLPLTYLPLIALGIVNAFPAAFTALCAGNGLAFWLGHEHRPSDPR